MHTFIYQVRIAILFLLFVVVLSCQTSSYKNSSAGGDSAGPGVTLQLMTDKIQSPVAMAVPGDGSNRLFICQKEGKVWIVQNGKLLAEPFLDVSNLMVKINPGYDERGLLGMAFHPDFIKNHKFYVYFSAPSNNNESDHKSILAEYQVSTNPNKADAASKRVVMEIEEPESNHNGGDLVFGPDGYLYICLGDGGGGGDRHGSSGNGQNLGTPLGKILRIDVNGKPYSVPKDNPFVGRPGVRPEIWAYGLRNPWRISFDKVTKQLFAGDVGQNKYEEVDIIQKGGNYGWRIKEGYHSYNVPSGGIPANLIDPIYEYDHNTGISIIGGYIYRGKPLAELKGKYIYGDYNGTIWALSKTGNKWENSDLNLVNKPNNMQLLSLGEDEGGELYLLVSFSSSTAKGAVYKIVRA
jgi:Glucose/sorbosone dehydrogenases